MELPMRAIHIGCVALAALLGCITPASALTQAERKSTETAINKKESWLKNEAEATRTKWAASQKSDSMRKFCEAGLAYMISTRQAEVDMMKLSLATDRAPIKVKSAVQELASLENHNTLNDFTTELSLAIRAQCETTEVTKLQ